jgi:hypothetical protein
MAAIRSIPFDKISKEDSATIKAVVAGSSIFRRLPLAVTDSDPALYSYLVRNPEIIGNIWEVMGVGQVSVRRMGPGAFQATDGAGTLCDVRFLYSHQGTHVIYADGKYEGPLFGRAVRGKCIMVLKSAALLETNGRHYVTSRMDTFLLLEQAGVNLLAKAVHPLVGKTTDYNFLETATFLGRLSRSSEVNPSGVRRLATKLTKIDDSVRHEFLEKVDQVAAAAQKREAVAEKIRREAAETARNTGQPASTRRW